MDRGFTKEIGRRGSGTVHQQTPPAQPHNGSNSEATALAQTANTIPNYASTSIAITPLPQNANVRILTPEEMSHLGPTIHEDSKFEPLGKFEYSKPKNPLRKNAAKYSTTLAGIQRNHPLAKAISRHLDQEFQAQGFGSGKIKRKSCEAGTTISFMIDSPDDGWKVEHAVHRTRNLVRNLHSLGFGPKTTAMLMGLKAVAQDLSAQAPWDLPNEPNEPKPDCSSRRECIEALMKAGCFDAAVALLSDLARVEDNIVGDVRRNDKIVAAHVAAHKETTREYKRVRFMLPDLASAKDSSSALSAFKASVCPRLCELERGSLYQAGAIVLRDVLTVDNDCSELQPYQIAVFQNIASYLKGWPVDQSFILQALFHCIDPADLFRTPKVRFLLLDVAGLGAVEYRDAYGEMTNLHDAFEKIDKHYHAIYFKSRKRLQEKFVIHDFPDRAEILARSPFTPVSEKSVEQLLQLAEAACMIGFEEEAVAVLEFLVPKEELSERHRAGLKPLADRILMSARFNPERQFRTSHYNAVKSRIDSIVFPESGQGKGQQKPEPGV